MILECIRLNKSLMEFPIFFSLSVKPGTKALVESAVRHKTPSLPKRANFSYSACGPTGVKSILKSP